jgi:hypothetical protein
MVCLMAAFTCDRGDRRWSGEDNKPAANTARIELANAAMAHTEACAMVLGNLREGAAGHVIDRNSRFVSPASLVAINCSSRS